jgi:hypothetical protein
MPDDQAHLRLADRHLAEAAERTARLRERIAERQLAGQCTAQAERLLDECETFMRLAVQHRQEILDAIAGGRPVPKASSALESLIARITFQG